MTLQRHTNALTPPLQLEAGHQGFDRPFGILSEVTDKQFCIRERNVGEPKDRAQKRQFCAFDSFWSLTVPGPLINCFTDNCYDARDHKMRRFSVTRLTRRQHSTCSLGGNFASGRITLSLRSGGSGASPLGAAGPANRVSKISVAKTQKPRVRLIRLIPVEILCRVCRLSNQSVVSTFESDARANLRLKLAVASIGFSLI